MAKAKQNRRTYEEAVNWFRDHGFEILEAPGTQNRVFLKKNNVSAAIEKAPDDGVKVFAHPGYLIGGEISKLVNKGYQQVLKTTKTEIAATEDHLRALHEFSEELKEAIGGIDLYNESLGTVSDSYHYDRLDGREGKAKKRPWEVPAGVEAKKMA
ncbi:MAG TPA: hypothetical protein VEG30_02615 [Terriglobales bacterium]|nr:hypothetical protein [Terriglobales bacterium]